MTLTPQQLEKVSHIPTEEVRQDLREAEIELHGYETEKDAIEKVGVNPSNKVRHFFLSAKCDKGREFVSELNQILKHRETLNQNTTRP